NLEWFVVHRVVALKVLVRVVSSDSSALHQPEKRELEVIPRVLAPAGDMAVEQILATLHAAGPEVSTCRDDLELLHHPDQVFTLIRDLSVLWDQREVPVYNSLYGLGPGLPFPVRLNTGVGALVHGQTSLGEFHLLYASFA